MGRRENAVAAGSRQLEALALWLRAQRQRQGITYAAMAQRINHEFTASILSRAASGKGIPTRQVVEAYARACGADPADGRRLWKAARYAAQAQRRQGTEGFQDLADKLGQALSHPKLIETEGQLRRAMVQLRARDGQPSLAELQRRAGLDSEGRHRLPKSSLGAVLRGDAVPTRQHVVAFAEAMGMSRRKVEEWEHAWDRVVGEEGPPPPVLPRPALRPSVPLFRHVALHTDPVWRTDPAIQQNAARLMHFYAMAMTDTPEETMALQVNTHMLNAAAARFAYRKTGPQPPLPPVGLTGSGLPIRTPRRYDLPPRVRRRPLPR
ncbi:helix-turn-helix domain-containing protein [Streptomyces sp. NPDC057411]|uniref:helix-turn-helix domain-containing protein n=1 Tax=unclassified Streptomyces TaxID=2593676 RepID=UPI0036250237